MRRILHWTGSQYEEVKLDEIPLNKNYMIKIIEVADTVTLEEIHAEWLRKGQTDDRTTRKQDLLQIVRRNADNT